MKKKKLIAVFLILIMQWTIFSPAILADDLKYFKEVEGGYFIEDVAKEKLVKLYDSLNKKIDDLQQALKEERKAHDDVIQIKNEKINNLEKQIEQLQKIKNDLEIIIKNKDKIIQLKNEEIDLLENKIKTYIEIQKLDEKTIELLTSQKENYKELYEIEQKLNRNNNIKYAAYGFVLGILASLFMIK
ncbi:MAG: hypothetical protein ACQEQF_00280 [Bacillota bacterium]